MRQLLPLILLLFCLTVTAQQNYYFSKLRVEDGLNDGHIQSVGEDRYGYVWFGSLGGLNRYDGRTIKTFSHIPEDPHSVLSGLAMSIVTDSLNDLIVAFTDGLMKFDFKNDNFITIESARNLIINQALPVSKTLTLLATETGIMCYNPTTSEIKPFTTKPDSPVNTVINEIEVTDGKLYIASRNGLFIGRPDDDEIMEVDLPETKGIPINTLTLDRQGNIWATTFGAKKIIRISAGLKNAECYDQYLNPANKTLSVNDKVIRDKSGRIWISSKYNGLMEYIPASNSFIVYPHDDERHWTLSTNANITIYSDREGNIWLGGNKGVNMFNPDRTFFQVIIPFKTDLSLRDRRFGRASVEDKDHNLWFGTLDGLVKYDRKTGKRQEWRNESDKPEVLARNHIRHLFCDRQNNVWISTSRGLNVYNRKTGKVEFFTHKSYSKGQYHMFTYEDPDGKLWFFTNSGKDGIIQYDPVTGFLTGCSDIPGLEAFAKYDTWAMLRDKKGRYWFGFESHGVGMYDPVSRTTQLWNSRESGWRAIAGDLVFDIKEDKNGVIWAASSAGLIGINPETQQKWLFNNNSGLGSNTALQLAVDQLNRIWVGTGRGLVMIDSSRTLLTSFGLEEGLPSTHFMEAQATVTPSGEIIMSTQLGYVLFDPMKYQSSFKNIAFYAPTYQVFNKEYRLPDPDKNESTIELNYDENFFTLNLRGINFINPRQTWYSYKLEGVDPEWHITQDPRAVYTNVSGGNYLFRYKATIDVNNWQVPEKTIRIKIATVFYKTWWFLSLVIIALAVAIIMVMQLRIRNARNWHALKSKAQLLEKEKTAVMYENLKQHLNPHFLFNSLASLSSLIRLDQKMAVDFLDKMSRVYRYILKNKDHDTVALIDEVKFVDMYIQLQKTRFEEGLQVVIDIPEAFYQHKIVPVTLQNLVENAIKHNITDPEEPLVVSIYVEDDYLVVRNNLQLKAFVETSNKQGLTSMISLYRFLSDKPVLIEPTEEFYTIRIPLI